MDREAFFWQIQDGRLPQPPAAHTLGMEIRGVSADGSRIEIDFEGRPAFCNPAGHIQGGFLAAMLDDTMGPVLAATLARGEFAPTVNLNVSFARPAVPGRIYAMGRVVRRGGQICLLAAELYQGGELLATATASAVIRRIPAPAAGSA